ncbi:MAG: hypothetical protein H7A09_00790 [Oceanospirillaceae bacterium]|nr:hypothetical protein [Oceanospirillaceae bacterium]MCP5335604.1 hypothetical protein [Oceanospirillaceae bacterium]
MTTLRTLLATLIFGFGIYLIFDLFQHGFSLKVLAASLGCFVAAHYIWPHNRDEDEESALLDALEGVVNLPYQILARLLRSVGNNKDHDFDLD